MAVKLLSKSFGYMTSDEAIRLDLPNGCFVDGEQLTFSIIDSRD